MKETEIYSTQVKREQPTLTSKKPAEIIYNYNSESSNDNQTHNHTFTTTKQTPTTNYGSMIYVQKDLFLKYKKAYKELILLNNLGVLMTGLIVYFREVVWDLHF